MFDTPFDVHDDRQRYAMEEEGDFVAADADEGEQQPAEGKPSRTPRWIVLGLIVLVLAASWFLLRGESAPAAAPPMPTVTVAAPVQREITEWDEYIERFEASRSVEVRPRVSGQVTAIHFTDGQFVRAGAPLFTIDARPYRASLAEAQARVASASSALALARSDLARAQRLVAEDHAERAHPCRAAADCRGA